MRRRNKAAKTRRRKRLTPKQRSASKAPHRNNFSPAREGKNVARLSRELNEAFEQQAATADILNIISKSPTDTQPVFEAIVQSVLKLFPNALISLALRYGDRINAAAVADRDPERAEAWRRTISRTPLSLGSTCIVQPCSIAGSWMFLTQVAPRPNFPLGPGTS